MVDPAVELDLSKENVQPLRRGRMVNQLENALRAQYDEAVHHDLLKQKDEFEIRLRTYEGDDPLEVWYEYVLWVEQSFIRDAREGNLSTILERCLKQFRDDERYHQDTRFIDLWLKHIEMSMAPLEIYKKCIGHGIGKYNALFYVAWAHDLENHSEVKRADQVLAEGLKNYAQPMDQLEKARQDLQVRVGQALINGSTDFESVKEVQRIALNKLRTYGNKRSLVNNVRVGSQSVRGTAGVLQPLASTSSNVQPGVFQVYNDEDDSSDSAEFRLALKHHLPKVPRREIMIKENTLKAGPWTGKPRKQATVHAPAPTVRRSQQPSFLLHEDEEEENDEQIHNTPTVVYNALKTRKMDLEVVSDPLFEPDDPTQRDMYCKNKVYAGSSEYSFEELRAIEYNRSNTLRGKEK